MGHDVQVLGFGELLPPGLPEQAKMLGFPWAVAFRLARTAHRSQFDVIDASTGDAWVVGVIRRAFPDSVRRPLVVTRSHGLEHTMAERRRTEAAAGGETLSWKYPLYHGGYRLWEVGLSLRSADLALFLNRYDAEVAVERLQVSSARTRVVRNGISEAFIGLASPLPSQRGGRIAVIGSYLQMKGIAQAAAALNKWLPHHPDWAVTFLGAGVCEERVLEDYDRKLHSRMSVVERYPNDDLPHLLDGHHVHLFPTLSEGGPVSLIEAMACGLVPVASSVPGVIDALSDGDDSILVPPDKPERIVAALERLAADRHLMYRLRTNAHHTAQSYGWRVVAGEQLDLYQEELERRS